jgi:hypothetical protein
MTRSQGIRLQDECSTFSRTERGDVGEATVVGVDISVKTIWRTYRCTRPRNHGCQEVGRGGVGAREGGCRCVRESMPACMHICRCVRENMEKGGRGTRTDHESLRKRQGRGEEE